MWSPRPALRLVALGLALSAPLLLAGCSGLRPVYGVDGAIGQVDVRYPEPANRLEQVIYSELALRLGKSRAGDAALVTVAANRANRALTNDTVGAPVAQHQVVVTGRVLVTAPSGEQLLSATRSASADYTAGPQGLANQQSEDDAADRAARQLADTLRLEVLAALGR